MSGLVYCDECRNSTLDSNGDLVCTLHPIEPTEFTHRAIRYIDCVRINTDGRCPDWEKAGFWHAVKLVLMS